MNGRVTVSRGELGQVRQLLEQAIAELDRLIEQQSDDGDWGDTGSGPGYPAGDPR